MEVFPRISNRFLSFSSSNPTTIFRVTPFLHFNTSSQTPFLKPVSPIYPNPITPARFFSSPASRLSAPRAGWLLGLGQKEQKPSLPDLVKAGDPVLHEPAREVDPNDIGSEKIQKIIDDMISVMREAPGVGLAAPQIGIPLKIIVLEDTREYISYAPKEEIKSQDRRAFDLLAEPAGRILEFSILHLAMSEISMLKTRHQIVINEAVDLAKRFCDGSAPRVINGCLRTFVQDIS